jgi:hypothetical protein
MGEGKTTADVGVSIRRSIVEIEIEDTIKSTIVGVAAHIRNPPSSVNKPNLD